MENQPEKYPAKKFYDLYICGILFNQYKLIMKEYFFYDDFILVFRKEWILYKKFKEEIKKRKKKSY